jgi:hypothetical protein
MIAWEAIQGGEQIVSNSQPDGQTYLLAAQGQNEQ